jgi:hypothetical protein
LSQAVGALVCGVDHEDEGGSDYVRVNDAPCPPFTSHGASIGRSVESTTKMRAALVF